MPWRTTISPIGVNLDGPFVQAAQLTWRKGRWRLSAAARIGRAHLPGEAFGLPIAEFKDVLVRRGFTGRRLIVGLPPEAMLTGVLDVPARSSGAPVDAIAKAELARMHQCDPQSLEAANWDLPAVGRRDTCQVMALACPHQTAETVLVPFEEAGLDVVALDSPLHGLARAAADEAGGAGLTAILQLGWIAATVVLLMNGRIVYHRTMGDCGLNRQAKALVEALEMPAEAIEAAFRAKTALRGDVDADDDFFDTITSTCQAGWRQLALELDAPFTYVRRQYGDAEIRGVWLTGQGAGVGEAPAFLAQCLRLPVRPLCPEDIVDVPITLGERRDDPSLIAAIGLAQFRG